MINLNGLKWLTYKGTEWTIAGRAGTKPNDYHSKKRYLTQGLELILGGKDLVEYKAAYLLAHGEVLKCPKLVVIDRERVSAYQGYMAVAIAPKEEAIPTNVMDELLRITQDKGLNWVRYEGSLYLPMVQVCLAKDMEKDDYSSNWQGGRKLPGIGILLEGQALHSFKTSYTEEHGAWPYPHTRSLCIGNWEHAYAYLVQGKSHTATTFQTMGANSIQHTIVGAHALHCPESWSSEEGLVDRVFKLMELSTISMQREACFFNSLGNTPTTRRVDAIEHVPGEDGAPDKVHVYEFKKGTITCSHVSETVGSKGYLHLARQRHSEAKVCLFMVGNDIDPQAQRLLDCMLGVMYLPLSTFLNRILTSIMGSWPKEGYYQLRTHFLSQYGDILPTEMLSGPVVHPQIVATYHKPTSLRATT